MVVFKSCSDMTLTIYQDGVNLILTWSIFCFKSAISPSEPVVTDAEAADASPEEATASFPLLGNVAELSDSMTMVANSLNRFN